MSRNVASMTCSQFLFLLPVHTNSQNNCLRDLLLWGSGRWALDLDTTPRRLYHFNRFWSNDSCRKQDALRQIFDVEESTSERNLEMWASVTLITQVWRTVRCLQCLNLLVIHVNSLRPVHKNCTEYFSLFWTLYQFLFSDKIWAREGQGKSSGTFTILVGSFKT